jgi:acetyl-CoA acetyltransferase family protein
VPQGVSAELIAHKWGFDRTTLDAFAERSQHLAAKASAAGAFDRELVPIRVPGMELPVTADETIRPDTTVAALAGLRSSFRTDEMVARFPELEWSMTAGNSSQVSDGASAVLLVSENMANKLGLKARARFEAFYACGDDPLLMLTGPIRATRKILSRSGLTLNQMDHVEVNEAFASVPLAWMHELGGDLERLNPRGGAIALGHPLGATGCRLLTSMLHALEDSNQRYGLQTVCEAGGMANALILERL